MSVNIIFTIFFEFIILWLQVIMYYGKLSMQILSTGWIDGWMEGGRDGWMDR